MSIISGPFLCFECSKPKEIVIAIHRLYSDKQKAQERIKKINELGYKDQRLLIWEIAGFVYKKSGAMIVFPIFMLQAMLINNKSFFVKVVIEGIKKGNGRTPRLLLNII